MSFSIIVAIDKKNGIGKNNQIPWHLSGDFKHFAKITKTTKDLAKQNAVLMGKNTWDSLPDKYKPLPERLNVVLIKGGQIDLPKKVIQYNSFNKALGDLEKDKIIENIFIIGGGILYQSTISHPKCEKIYLTRIDQDFNCDIFFPAIPDNFKLVEESEVQEEKGIKYKFLFYEK